jgi:DinB superfamily/Pentapeptide repeats (8 copies)
MAEVFEDKDFSGAVFWGVKLAGARFRDTDFDEAHFFHTQWRNVSIDGEVHGLVVNGVDVTDFVNKNDRWYPLRYELSPSDAVGLHSSWNVLKKEWSGLLSRVADAAPSVAETSVDNEWSLLDTLRHLVFAMDKWFTWPILGSRSFSPLGLPNTGSQGGEWPGLDINASIDFEAVLRVRQEQHEGFTEFIETLDVDALSGTVDVLENGAVPTLMCLHVVLEEEFEHLRYMIRDLERLGVSPSA